MPHAIFDGDQSEKAAIGGGTPLYHRRTSSAHHDLTGLAPSTPRYYRKVIVRRYIEASFLALIVKRFVLECSAQRTRIRRKVGYVWFLLEILDRDLDSPLEVEHRIGIKSYDFMNFFLLLL